ncbi:hypothetical protein MLD38_014616 [Melastoma candidum]|uniref:Uncharacterized protein n=1 Tax=Melastoma candidum TaxID=119954 RepID=A0ACB9RDX5_9MYRT|nr:hypothetical protein MLD38_014616 [Melastoma candidum]
MEANAGMVAGSYKRNELVRIRHDSDGGAVSVLWGSCLFHLIPVDCADLCLDLADSVGFRACNEGFDSDLTTHRSECR